PEKCRRQSRASKQRPRTYPEFCSTLRPEGEVTDPQSRIAQLERGIRRWRRAALILASALVFLVVASGVLLTRTQVTAERERQAAIQARDEAEARRAFREKK